MLPIDNAREADSLEASAAVGVMHVDASQRTVGGINMRGGEERRNGWMEERKNERNGRVF